MVTAGERRSDALSVNEPINLANIPISTCNNNNSNSNFKNQNTHPMRHSKQSKGKRSLKKCSRITNDIATNDENQNVTHEAEIDEEEQSLHWAYSILIKEFHRRNDLRVKTKVTSKVANEKLKSFLAFKKLKEEHQKKEHKKKGSMKKKPNESNLPSQENKDTTKGSANDENVLNKADEVKEQIEIKKETDKIVKKETKKKSVEIVNLHDQIQSKKKFVSESNEASNITQIFKSNTEKDKIKEARKTLRELNERAERKMKEKELQDQMELDTLKDDETGIEVKEKSIDVNESTDSNGFIRNNSNLNKSQTGK